MPLSHSAVVGTGSGSGTTVATGSVTVTSGRTALMWAAATHATTPFTDTTTCSGQSLTWTQVASYIEGNNIIVLFRSTGTRTTGAATVTWSQSAAQARCSEIEVGANSGDAVATVHTSSIGTKATATGTGTTGTVTPTFPQQSHCYTSCWAHAVNEATAPDATGQTWTELSDTASTAWSMEVQVLHSNYDTSHTATWATSSAWYGMVVELIPATMAAVTHPADDDLELVSVGEGVVSEDLDPPVAADTQGYW